MKINGVEIENIDFTDADLVERFDTGCKDVGEKVKKLKEKQEELNPAEGIRQECKIVKDFFDYVFGEGTSEKIFEGKDSLLLCTNAYEDIVNIRNKQYKEYYDKINKYSPERVQR